MAEVLGFYGSDSPGYTHFVLTQPYTGLVVATVKDIYYGYTSPPNPDGSYDFQKGDPVTTITVGLDDQRDFEISGTITLITFDDGTTYTPGD